jgi:Spy/CpxP family protein refolding chaperone
MRPLTALLAILLCCVQATAQLGSIGGPVFRGEFAPEFSARDLKVIIRVLDLKPDAQQALQALYDNYTDTLRREGDAVKESVAAEIDRAELLNNRALLEPAQKQVEDFRKRAAQLGKTFLEDVKSLLTREQEESWPILQRELRRIKRIGKGRLAGESADIVRLVEDLIGDAPMPPRTLELLNLYRLEIDRALIARDEFLSGDAKDFSELTRSDPTRAAKLFTDAQSLRQAVRDINERFARQIAAELSPEQAAALDAKLFELSYPMLLRDARGDLYLKDALALESITLEQKSQLQALKASRQAERLAWARQAAPGWRDLEDDVPDYLASAMGAPVHPMDGNQFNGSWLPQNHPLQQARLRRAELDRALRTRIDQILTPDQRAEIPSRLDGYAKFEVWLSGGI